MNSRIVQFKKVFRLEHLTAIFHWTSELVLHFVMIVFNARSEFHSTDFALQIQIDIYLHTMNHLSMVIIARFTLELEIARMAFKSFLMIRFVFFKSFRSFEFFPANITLQSWSGVMHSKNMKIETSLKFCTVVAVWALDMWSINCVSMHHVFKNGSFVIGFVATQIAVFVRLKVIYWKLVDGLHL